MSTTAVAATVAPSTPLQRNRSLASNDVATSPSSTTISESAVSTAFHQPDVALRAHAPAGLLASRKITIRSDPALLTCFDAADRQLYDLWVPKA